MGEMIKNYWLELKNGTKTMFKEFFNKDTNKKQRANMWTFSRLVTSFLIPICSLISILTANISLFIVSIGITAFGGLTDFFDGRSARKHNSYSEFGKFLDQITDKIFAIMIGITLSIFNPLFLITLCGEIGIASINVLYKSKNPNLDIKSTYIGKLKQGPLFGVLTLGFMSPLIPIISPITNIFILITFIFQIMTAGSYIKSNEINIQKINNIDNKNIKLNEDINDEENEKVKTKSIDNKSSTKLEQYTKLRILLDEIIYNNIIEKEDTYQKTKK